MDTTSTSDGGEGPAKRRRRRFKSYLLKAEYREVGLSDARFQDDDEAARHIEQVRWGELGSDTQRCPHCATVASHYRYRARPVWKCRDDNCGKQFSVMSGTRLHALKLGPAQILSTLLHFLEAKDSISAREISGLFNIHYQTARDLLMKIREALRETRRMIAISPSPSPNGRPSICPPSP